MKGLPWLFVVVGLVGLVGCGSDEDGGLQDVSTHLSFSWTRISDEEFRGDFDFSAPTSVAAGGPGLVIVGGWGDVWTSADGTTWTPGEPTDTAWFDVIAGGPGLVAVGTVGFDVAAVMTSTDGISWSRIPHDQVVSGQTTGGVDTSDVTMYGVADGGPGLVAVGTDGRHGVVWTSSTGTSWERVPDSDGVFRNGKIFDVTTGGPGVIAVGSVLESGAVWTSPDGITWSRVPHDEALFGVPGENGKIASVTSGGPGWVAVGNADDHPTIWASVDGATWSRVPYDEDVFDDDAVLSSVTATDGGLVAVGHQGFDAAVWTSSDSTTWFRVQDDDGIFRFTEMTDVAVGGPGLIAVGSYHEGGDAGRIVAAVWIATPT